MPDEIDEKTARTQKIKKYGLIAAVLFLVYVILGFWVIPPLLKPRVEEQLSNLLGRKVSIQKVELNPLLLTATTSNLVIYEQDGEPFAGFEELFANAQLSSLFKWAITVREIRIQKPFGALKILPGNKLNINDILEKLSEPKEEPEEKGGVPRAVIERFSVVDGKATIEDLLGKEPISETFTPITFELENLSTLEGREGEFQFVGVGPLGGKFELNGKITVNPANVHGNFSTEAMQLKHFWEHIEDHVSFQILNGSVTTSGDYAAGILDGQLDVKVENVNLDLTDFELVEKGKKDILISIPTLTVKEIGADLQAREVNVGTFQTADGKIKSWLAADGTFEHQELFLEDIKKLTGKKATDEKETASSPGDPWLLLLKKMEVKNWGVVFEDRILTKPARLSVDNLSMVLENLSNQKDRQGNMKVSMQINRAGDVTVKGTVGINPIQADIKVSTRKITLKPFQPYVDDAVKAQVLSGTTSSSGRVQYFQKDVKPQIRYEGEVRVDEVEIQDSAKTDDFITLAQLKVSGIALDLAPNKLYTSDVLIDRPHARVTIDENGMVNVINTFTPVEKKEGEEEEQDLRQRLVSFLILQFKGPMPMQVDHVQLMNFTGDFVDDSISPGYSTHIEIKEGTVDGLSSDPSDRADFKFNGKIDQAATLKGTGQMNPMNARAYSRVNVSLKDFPLKPVSPYSGKFISYKIDRGTLNTELKYIVKEDNVNGDNIILIDHLELGESVDSPDAINLPIKLGVALLKDSDDRISVQVPVTGDVKDPQFSVMDAITSALTGTVNRAGDAPFASIKEIDGFTGEELSTIEFDFGSSELGEREIRKLNAVAKFLKERTSLILGIMGTADRNRDGAVLAGEQAGDKLTEKKKPSEKESKKDQKEAAAVQAIDPATLKQLAQDRAEKVSLYLSKQTHVEAGKVHFKPVQIKASTNENSGLVELSLSVE